MTDERPADRPEEPEPSDRDRRTGRAAAAARIEQQASWVDLQVRQALARGDFDDLPGLGQPLPDLGAEHDPDWWLKRLIEREQVTGVLPPALQLRKDDAELDVLLDSLAAESAVRRQVEDFNERVRKARYQPLGGPPMVTSERDVDVEVERWCARRTPAPPAHEEDRVQSAQVGSSRRWRWWHRPRE